MKDSHKVPLAVFLFLGCILIGYTLSLHNSLRILRVEHRIDLLTQRLQVTPRDVLCSLSSRLEVLHQSVSGHCQTVHGTNIPEWVPIPFCQDYTPDP